jgi:transposase
MEFACLLLGHSPLQVMGLRITPQGVTLITVPVAGFGFCPACGVRSARVHSRYRRKLHDLPAHGRPICLELHLRRFFCDLPDCPRDTFAERLPQIAAPHARKTDRLIDVLQETAFTTGGEAGSRLAGQLGMPASADTLLRLLRRAVAPACDQNPRVLGVDDWAMRRGQIYGTILCDLESHRPVDLLPERSSQAFAAWLGDHPGARIISRDRGGDYAHGAAVGAPDAIQVADRWHLLHNLTEALQRAVDRRQQLLGEVAKEVAAALAPIPLLSAAIEPAGPISPTARISRADQKKQESRERRLARYQQVQELIGQCVSQREIRRRLKMSRESIKRFARSEQFPERATPTARPIPIGRYLAFLKQRWEEGCDNVKQLWQEIRAKGFTGSIYMVRRQVRRWRRSAGLRPVKGQQPIATPRIIRPSARRIAWLALGHVQEPTAQDEAILKALYQRWPELPETAELCRQFASLLKGQDDDSLEAWVQLAQGPGILPELRRFAEALRQDWAAVVQGIRQPWSQGQVEGQINRLKLIKRQMYGRANFDLLRQRVLHARRA